MKNKISKQRHGAHKKQRRFENIILVIVAASCIAACGWELTSLPNFSANLHDAFHKLTECLKQKLDHIVEIVVIIILATIKWFVEHLRE